jgi:hypothetical protein
MTLLEIVDNETIRILSNDVEDFSGIFATTFNAIAESTKHSLFLTLVNKTLKAKNRLQSQYRP